ncbi:MAG: carbon monoxide dehydrogenase subunit G [Trueperaceae bacterium]|nr:carbon monoxide dehydrogenase subunit G [Trueperaceae bacterium]
MKLNYDGQEQINADYDAVWAFINNPEKVAKCLPDVEKLEITGDKSFTAHVKVGVGPVRGRFKFDVGLEPDAENNKMNVNLRGGGLGTAIDLTAGANIAQQQEQTQLDWQGEAVVRGPAATVGARVLDRKARELITHVFAEVKRNIDEEQA